jgi:hypothetical protein
LTLTTRSSKYLSPPAFCFPKFRFDVSIWYEGRSGIRDRRRFGFHILDQRPSFRVPILFYCARMTDLWIFPPTPTPLFYGQVCRSFASSLWGPWSAADSKLNCGEHFSAAQFGMVGNLTTTANNRIAAQRRDSGPSNPVQGFS